MPSSPDARFGFWAALGTAATTLLTAGIAVSTPPLSGPFCKVGCVGYPYLEVVERFPRDYYWMFPAVPATLFFVAFMLGLKARAVPERRLLAEWAVALAVMAALVLAGDYVVQLAVVQPSLLAGEADGIALVTQYNPHGLFIALEELGYVLMSASLGCMAFALPRTVRLERAVRTLFAGGFFACVAALVGLLAQYGHQREYLFEVAVISIVWLTLIPGAVLMTLVFRRAPV
jgi:hypothetical protein